MEIMHFDCKKSTENQTNARRNRTEVVNDVFTRCRPDTRHQGVLAVTARTCASEESTCCPCEMTESPVNHISKATWGRKKERRGSQDRAVPFYLPVGPDIIKGSPAGYFSDLSVRKQPGLSRRGWFSRRDWLPVRLSLLRAAGCLGGSSPQPSGAPVPDSR